MTGWSDYYGGQVTPDLYIRNLYGQREFLQMIVETGAKKVLEVGAGTGTMSIFLSQLGGTVTTLDNDPKIIEQARLVSGQFGGRNDIVVGDAFHLPFPNDSFDLIFHQGLLEHFSNERICELIIEHLRVAPIVLISVPNNFYPRKDFGDERLMSKKQWEQILAPFKVSLSRNYSLKILPKWYLPRVPIQYMAKLERR